jgi:hypothetical protein
MTRKPREHLKTFKILPLSPTSHWFGDKKKAGRTQPRGDAGIGANPDLPGVMTAGLFPLVYLLLSFLFGDSIGFLNLSRQLLPVSFNLVNLVISELAPLFTHGSFYLFPITDNLILVH